MNRTPRIQPSRRISVIRLLFAILLSSTCPSLHIIVQAQQQQDPSTLNGGSILAMTGNDCVAVAVDKRFGSGPALVNIEPRPVLLVDHRVLVAFSGLAGDIESLQDELSAQVARRYQRGLPETTLQPSSMASLTSHVMYARRKAPYYVEPMVVGLSSTGGPYLCSMDMIGAQSSSDAFCGAGAAAASLLGTAEAMWKPNLSPEQLVEVCAAAFLAAVERDCLSGYGAIVYLITSAGITEYDIEGRDD